MFYFQVNAEFVQITTKPLQVKFLAQLDNLTDKLMQIFEGSKGAKGQKIKDIMAISSLVSTNDKPINYMQSTNYIFFTLALV